VIGGYTFTVGSQGPGDNKFMDSHMMNYSSLKLRAGVNSAVATHSQSYKCCATKSYGFTVTHTCARLQNPERIKDTVTKN
jgi:hypothetical protein